MLVPAVTLALGFGCGKKSAEAPTTDAPLARVNDTVITEDDVAFEVERRRSAGRPIGEPREILQDLIERQAMLQKAESSGVFDDPHVRRELENRRLGQWLDRSLQIERDAVTVSDDELLAHYEAHRESFTAPAMIRLAVLYRRDHERDPSDDALSLRTELEQARQRYLDDPAGATRNGTIPGFGVVAAEASEDTVSRYRGGDLGWLETDAWTQRLPAVVAETGLALPVGGVSDVMAVGNELYVVMKADERPPRITPFEEAKTGLRRRVIREKQQTVEQVFRSNVLAATRVEINADKAERLTVPQPAPPEALELRPAKEFAPRGSVPASPESGRMDE
ncbi:MAG TPA: peptidyl-prolyl cis-trans isomerase [Kiritimatiellia bacterium]|nr:peptidyl-prolyl cis-trans isomerase [Kiritimatiellia bacterium]